VLQVCFWELKSVFFHSDFVFAVCQSQADSTVEVQTLSNQDTKHGHTNSNSANIKKKKNKGNNNSCSQQQQNNPPAVAAATTKSQHSTAKNTPVPKASSGGNSGFTQNCGGKQQALSSNNKSSVSHMDLPSPVMVDRATNDLLSVISPLTHAPSIRNQFTTGTAIQINNVINTISSAGKAPPVSSSVASHRFKPEASLPAANSPSFSLENLKLPPGITITKVDGPSAASLRKSQSKPSESSKSTHSMTSNHSSSTVVSGLTPTGSSGSLRFREGGGISQGISGSNVIVVDTVKMKEELEVVTVNGGESAHNNSSNSKKKNKKKNKNQNSTASGSMNGQPQRQQQLGNGVAANQVNGKHINSAGGKNQNLQNGTNVRIQSQVHPLLAKNNIRPQTIAMNASQLAQQPAIIKVNGSMVTIRNPALQQAMAANSRFPPQGSGRAEILVNGEVPASKPGNKPSKKSVNMPTANGIVGVKGKENGTVPPRFANADNAMLQNRLVPHVECNGLNSIPGLHISKVNTPVGRAEENGIAVRGSANILPPRMRIQQQQSPPSHMAEVRKVNHNHINTRQEDSPLQHSSAARSAMREAMAASLAAANDAKKKKKKKKGAGGQGHSDDWNLVGKYTLLKNRYIEKTLLKSDWLCLIYVMLESQMFSQA